MELVTAGLAYIKELSAQSSALILYQNPDNTPLCQGPVPGKDGADRLIIPGEHPMENQILPRIKTQNATQEFEDETVNYG
jgi:hypothetical protein